MVNPNEKARHDAFHGPGFNYARCPYCKKENPYWPNNKKAVEMENLAKAKGVIP